MRTLFQKRSYDEWLKLLSHYPRYVFMLLFNAFSMFTTVCIICTLIINDCLQEWWSVPLIVIIPMMPTALVLYIKLNRSNKLLETYMPFIAAFFKQLDKNPKGYGKIPGGHSLLVDLNIFESDRVMMGLVTMTFLFAMSPIIIFSLFFEMYQ